MKKNNQRTQLGARSYSSPNEAIDEFSDQIRDVLAKDETLLLGGEYRLEVVSMATMMIFGVLATIENARDQTAMCKCIVDHICNLAAKLQAKPSPALN